MFLYPHCAPAVALLQAEMLPAPRLIENRKSSSVTSGKSTVLTVALVMFGSGHGSRVEVGLETVAAD